MRCPWEGRSCQKNSEKKNQIILPPVISEVTNENLSWFPGSDHNKKKETLPAIESATLSFLIRLLRQLNPTSSGHEELGIKLARRKKRLAQKRRQRNHQTFSLSPHIPPSSTPDSVVAIFFYLFGWDGMSVKSPSNNRIQNTILSYSICCLPIYLSFTEKKLEISHPFQRI